ncbi:MAG TPA: HRDC domain-containing protein [Gemmatimonadales bacterium]|nr:HRDC domain-containing protein [Gemmatimonadales bacterium]
MPLHLIQTLPEYADLLERLRLEPLVAVDTEAASFHRHKDRVYLLQLSTRTETHLVDPLAVAGLPGFGELLADPAIELVFHDADYDLRLLGYEFGFRATTLFDTRIAAQFLNEPGIGLAAMLQKYVGVTPDKRFQRADWSVRPLTQPMLEYAAMDTRHLPVLRDILRDRLTERGKLTWAEEEFALATAVRWPAPESPEVAALSMKGARALSPRGLAVFRELYVWRTRAAETLDRAAFRIIGTEALVALAERTPKDAAGLAAIPGVGKDLVDRRGPEILAAIERGLEVAESDLPRFPRAARHRPDPAFEGRLERLKALRVRLVGQLDLQPGVISPNWLLEGVARAAPKSLEELGKVEGIRRWQIAQFGKELLDAVG